MEERIEKITELYKKLLKREPDDSGLMSYLHSDLEIEEIEYIIKNSTEYTGLKSKENFGESVEKVGNSELFVMGSSPKTNEHSNSLKQAGVQAVLDLNLEVGDYDTSWCEDFLHVPIEPGKPLTKETIDKCFGFIRKNVVDKKQRVFLHSERGISRAPMLMILFLVADKGLSFYTSLRLVHSKQRSVSPERALMSADILEYVYNYRKKYGTKKRDINLSVSSSTPNNKSNSFLPPEKKVPQENSIIRVSSKLFAGFAVNEEILDDLNRLGITTLLDLNLNPKLKSLRDSRFSNIHLPLFVDQLETLMPMIMKSVDRYLKEGGLYVYCEDQGLVKSILDEYVKYNPEIMKELKQQKQNSNKSLERL